MATRYIDKVAAVTTTNTPNFPDAAGIAYDVAAGVLKYNDVGTLRSFVNTDKAQTLTNKTLTSPVITGASITGSTPVSVTTTPISLTAATHGGKTVIANKVDGITFTLPAATGSGVKFRVVVGTTLTSSSLVLAVVDGTDFMRGRAIFSNDTDGSASNFETANTGTLATESDTMTWNRTTTGIATIGDLFECEDIATDIWSVTAYAQASGTEATPFTAAV